MGLVLVMAADAFLVFTEFWTLLLGFRPQSVMS